MRAAALIGLWTICSIRLSSAADLLETSPPVSKRGFNQFNPTSDSLLRELTTDRPDKTESPYTVDAGHFQVEMDLLSYSRDGGEDSFAIAPVNLKVGLLNNVDLQFIAQTYNIQRDRSGFGDALVRLKVNFWGNDGGATAFAAMPFLKFPTNQHELGNSAVEGGIIFPFALALPGKFDLGTMVEVDYIRDANNSGYHEEFISSITLGHALVGQLSGYAEFFNAVSTERDAGWVSTFDFGFTYKLTSNIQLDAGLNIGLTRAADDLNPFIGVSYRY
jgi:Putative MetA-pathway of phenol degradation